LRWASADQGRCSLSLACDVHRAYGEALDSAGKVTARAWCEAVVQRVPEYLDPANPPEEPARRLQADGSFEDNPGLTRTNRRFGRSFHIVDFRWLSAGEI